jgi:uncharacterized protein (DUF427 family)
MTKEVRTPGRDHPISITDAGATVRVRVKGRVIAESSQALRLEEKESSRVQDHLDD